MIRSFFSLRKSKKVFSQYEKLYQKKKQGLDEYTRSSIRSYLEALQGAILSKDVKGAKSAALELEKQAQKLIRRSKIEKFFESSGRIIGALLIAVIIRTMWFELYTIPTGSMRPTLKEDDYLIVSKTNYGINVPLRAAHFYFDEKEVKRGSVIVFNGIER